MTSTVKMTTQRGDWRLGAAANLTNTSAIAARSLLAAAPADGSDRCVLDASANLSQFMFLGTDGDGETINFTILGWRRVSLVDSSGEAVEAWAAVHLATGTATLSSSITGVAGATPNGSGDMLADTIAVSAGTDAAEVVEGVADVLPAHLVIDPRGCDKIEVFLQRGTAASANVLYAEL
jgi:hypothetical protein